MLLLLLLLLTTLTGIWGFQALLERDGLSMEQGGPGPFEWVAGAGLTGLLALLALDWCLALLRCFTPLPLLVGAALMTLGSALFLTRGEAGLRGRLDKARRALGGFRTLGDSLGRLPRPLLGFILAPVAIWLIFALWRGSLMMPQNHDALAYHFPKAVLILKAKGYAFFQANDYRIPSTGANYELLLGDAMMLTGSDRWTAGISTLFYLLLPLQAMAMAERWWGKGTHLLAMGLLVAGLPVALLHASGHKNDLLATLLTLAALHWAFRWWSEGKATWGVLGMAAWVAGIGTKLSACMLLPAVVPFLLLAFWKAEPARRRWFGGRILPALGLFVLANLLLGGYVYLLNLLKTGHLSGFSAVSGAPPGSTNVIPFYGQWENLWMWPILVLKAPFSGNPMSVWVPWAGEPWFWPRYELYSAHWGALVSLLVFALPLIWGLGRKRLGLPGAVRTEAIGMTVTALLFALLLLPAGFKTLGWFNGYARYLLFLPVFVGLWSLCPLLRWLEEVTPRRAAPGLLVVLSLVFGFQAVDYAVNDRFVPLGFTLEAANHPGGQKVHFAPHRAALALDRLAGPGDVVAFDGGVTDSWIYPAYGEGLTRKVIILTDQGGGDVIPPEADWVVVDRGWFIIWEHPQLTDMGRARRFLNAGEPRPEDLKVAWRLSQDPEWKLVYCVPGVNQAVFQRKRPGRNP